MRVVVTGAAGSLGHALLPRLARAGHDAVGFDVRRGTGPAEWMVGDVRRHGDVARSIAGADVVVHGAALHGIHLADHSPREFYDLNVTGTFNVWAAAVAHSVKGVVFSSSMGVYGESRRPDGGADVAFVHEDMPLEPADVYGWTKVVGEELSRYHLREHGIASVALRFGMFVPETFFRYGIRLLYGGVHVDDAAESVMAAIDALASGRVTHEAFNVEAPLPFTDADARGLRDDPLAVLDRHWPGAASLLHERGVRSLKPVTAVFPIARLEAKLSLRPAHDFGSWLDELARRPEERTASDPPWP